MKPGLSPAVTGSQPSRTANRAMSRMPARKAGTAKAAGEAKLALETRADALQTQLPVLDLADVGQIGRHAGNSGEREPCRKIELVTVRVPLVVWGSHVTEGEIR